MTATVHRMSSAEFRAGMEREDQIQADIVAELRRDHPDCLIFAIPNGGARTAKEGAKFKWTGVLAGVPDLIVVKPGGRCLFIEVKKAKGVLSEAQQAIRHHCERYEVPWALARSVEDARAAMERQGNG